MQLSAGKTAFALALIECWGLGLGLIVETCDWVAESQLVQGPWRVKPWIQMQRSVAPDIDQRRGCTTVHLVSTW